MFLFLGLLRSLGAIEALVGVEEIRCGDYAFLGTARRTNNRDYALGTETLGIARPETARFDRLAGVSLA